VLVAKLPIILQFAFMCLHSWSTNVAVQTNCAVQTTCLHRCHLDFTFHPSFLGLNSQQQTCFVIALSICDQSRNTRLSASCEVFVALQASRAPTAARVQGQLCFNIGSFSTMLQCSQSMHSSVVIGVCCHCLLPSSPAYKLHVTTVLPVPTCCACLATVHHA
jgi:hypothetical protein